MTPSAHALGSVLAAGPGFQAPGLEAFYPTPIFTFSIGGLDFAITRITVALWFATLAVIAFLIATVRKPQIVPGQAAVPRGERLLAGPRRHRPRRRRPRGAAVRAVPRVAVLLHPGEQPVVDRAADQHLADVEVRVPAGPRPDLLRHVHLGRHPRAGPVALPQGHPLPARRPGVHVHPGDADRDPAELHRPAVHAGRPALRQHVRRPHAAAGLHARRDRTCSPSVACPTSSARSPS